MQSVLSRIWTRIAVSISSDDNHYTTGTSIKKMVLDETLVNTQHYKVWIKGEVDQSWEMSRALPLHLGVVATEKGAFGSPSTTVANFT